MLVLSSLCHILHKSITSNKYKLIVNMKLKKMKCIKMYYMSEGCGAHRHTHVHTQNVSFELKFTTETF